MFLHLALPWAFLSAHVEGEWIVFHGGAHGEHRIARATSSAARIAAHWQGYVAANLRIDGTV
jgi:predicted N-acyltransferase